MGFITKLLEKRSFENQSWINDWVRGKDYPIESYTGVDVSPENAIKYSAVLACGRLLSETIASLPLFLYKRLPNNGKEKATDHSLYKILHTQPNSEMTSFAYREMMIWHILFWGNSYSYIQSTAGEEVLELLPLLPWKMVVSRTESGLIYKYRMSDNTEKIFPAERILHIPGMSFNGIIGKSLLSCAREAVGLGMALEEFGAKFFGQGTQFGGFLETDKKSIDAKAYANLRSSLKEKYQGLSNSHRLFILEDGMKYKQNLIPPNDSQWLESRKFQVIDVARIFNVPLHLIQELDRATFNNIEELGIGYVKYSIRPWLVRIEQAETIELLSEAERDNYFIEHLVEGLLRGDIKTRYEAYNIARLGGWMNMNEIRSKENMNPVPGDQGEDYWMPLNYITTKQAGQLPLQSKLALKEVRANRGAALKGRIANSYRKLFEDTTVRIIKLEKTPILKAAKSIFGTRKAGSKKFEEFLNQFYKKEYDNINRHSKPTIDTFGKVIAVPIGEEIGEKIDSIELDKYMDEYTEAFNARYIGTSTNRLNETVSEAIDNNLDPVGAIETQFNYWEENRPATTGLKETFKIAGAVSIFAYALFGIKDSVWVTAGPDPCPFCVKMSGKTSSTGGDYMGEDDIMKVKDRNPLTFPSSIAHPPLHGGCVCVVMPA